VSRGIQRGSSTAFRVSQACRPHGPAYTRKSTSAPSWRVKKTLICIRTGRFCEVCARIDCPAIGKHNRVGASTVVIQVARSTRR
jgi:hypothetical protein